MAIITVSGDLIQPKNKETHRCWYCGHVGTDMNRAGTHHVGGIGELEHFACDNEARCMKNVHNNVRYGRESYDDGEEVKAEAK